MRWTRIAFIFMLVLFGVRKIPVWRKAHGFGIFPLGLLSLGMRSTLLRLPSF
jgi:hypothetical protein